MRIWPTKRFWKRLAIGLAILVALALIANGFMSWRTERWLLAKIAAIRAAGDPASIADLVPKSIPAAENAAVILQQLGPRLDAFSKEYGRFSESAMGEAFDERVYKGEPPTPEQIAAIRAIVDKYPEIPAGLATAAACEKYASMADYAVDHQTFLDNWLKSQMGRVRNAARFLQWRAEVLLTDGRNEEVVEQGIELMRIARLYDAEPLLVNYLVGIAVRGMAVNMLYDALAVGPVRPDLHAELEKELALHDTPQRLVHALKTDRAYAVSVVAEAGTTPALDQSGRFFAGFVNWPMKRHFIEALDHLDAQVVVIVRTWPNANKPVGRASPPSRFGLGELADLLMPATEAAYHAEARIVGMMRALRVFNLLTQHRSEKGQEAAGLGDLKQPAAATIDPYSGKPLLLKQTGDGWVVYSVMKDGTDDGGDFKGFKDYGVAPRSLRSDFRIGRWRK